MKKNSKRNIDSYRLVHKPIIVDGDKVELVLLKRGKKKQNIGYVCGHGRVDVPYRNFLGIDFVDKEKVSKRVEGPLKREYKSYEDIKNELIEANIKLFNTDITFRDDILTFEIKRDSRSNVIYIQLNTEYTLRDEAKENHPNYGLLYTSGEEMEWFHKFEHDKQKLRHFKGKREKHGLGLTIEGAIDAVDAIWQREGEMVYLEQEDRNQGFIPETQWTAEEEFFDIGICPVHDFKVRIMSPKLYIKDGECPTERLSFAAERCYQVIGQIFNRKYLVSSGLRKIEEETKEQEKKSDVNKKVLESHEIG